MKIEFKKNNNFKDINDIFIRDGKKLLKIFYGANGDLYFDIFGSHNKDEFGRYNAPFIINQTDDIYLYFENLINDIINCHVYDESDIDLWDFLEENKNTIKVKNENLKSKNNYQRLVQNNAIIFFSDNIYDEKANQMKIEIVDKSIVFTFVDNPLDPTDGFGIRISNSGSKYEPFNICFMNFFNQLEKLSPENNQNLLVRTLK